jgi:hypothetical protein
MLKVAYVVSESFDEAPKHVLGRDLTHASDIMRVPGAPAKQALWTMMAAKTAQFSRDDNRRRGSLSCYTIDFVAIGDSVASLTNSVDAAAHTDSARSGYKLLPRGQMGNPWQSKFGARSKSAADSVHRQDPFGEQFRP